MPWTHREFVQLGLLLLCVPLQYYVSNYGRETLERNRSDIILNFVKEVWAFKDSWLSSRPLKHQWSRFLSWFVINVLGIKKNVVEEESPAIEVFKYRKKMGLYGDRPTAVRSERPKQVWYRVGQVVENTSEGYRGVIFDWYVHKTTKQTIYALLIDEENKVSTKIVAEVTQDKIYLLKKTQIKSAYLKVYFLSYDGAQYIPQPWLREMYPKD